jgi:hypothetical protein
VAVVAGAGLRGADHRALPSGGTRFVLEPTAG